MNSFRWIAGCVAIFLALPALGQAELRPHSAEYKVKISVVSGQLNTELRKTDKGYIANHVIRATGVSKLLTRGSMDVTSEFASTESGIRPVRYQAVDTIRHEPEVDLTFDWSTNRAFGTVGDEEVQLQLEGMAYDSVSIQYELMHDLLAGNAAEQYTLFDVDKMRVANVTMVGERDVETQAGRFTAIGVRHQKEGSSRTTTLWCVKDLDYLPVIIEQHRKGKLNFRAKLVRYMPSPG